MIATIPGSHATSHANNNTKPFAASLEPSVPGSCNSSFNAPLSFSDDTIRIATNGNNRVAARSYAPHVGTRTPSSGDRPCGSAAGPPLPLISAYKPTAVMKLCPTRNPTNNSNNQNARDASSSRNSFASSRRKLCERKENLLQPTILQIRLRLQLRKRSFGNALSGIQQHETIANLRRIV